MMLTKMIFPILDDYYFDDVLIQYWKVVFVVMVTTITITMPWKIAVVVDEEKVG